MGVESLALPSSNAAEAIKETEQLSMKIFHCNLFADFGGCIMSRDLTIFAIRGGTFPPPHSGHA
jgi:hypothetical protein